jgi:hypothetical protein
LCLSDFDIEDYAQMTSSAAYCAFLQRCLGTNELLQELGTMRRSTTSVGKRQQSTEASDAVTCSEEGHYSTGISLKGYYDLLPTNVGNCWYNGCKVPGPIRGKARMLMPKQAISKRDEETPAAIRSAGMSRRTTLIPI